MRTELATQRRLNTYQAVYEQDFGIRIVREFPGQEIDLSKIRVFLAWMRAHGFKIRGISCDLRSLSTDMRQILVRMGFNAVYLSVDKKRDPYDVLKQTLVERRLHLLNDANYLCQELVNLEDNGDKIDHPDNFDIQWRRAPLLEKRGSKDIADGLAGCVYLAETDADRPSIPLFSMEDLRKATGLGGKGTEGAGEYIPDSIIMTF